MTIVTVMTGEETGVVGQQVALPVPEPYDAHGIFRFLAARAIDGMEVADVDSDPSRLRYARTLLLPHGPGAVEVIAAREPDGSWEVHLSLEATSLADVAPAVARIRRLLDLDVDPAAVDSALAEDPHLAPLVRRTPGIRVPGAVDPHELLMRAIVGQQISVARATAHLNRLVEVAGSRWSSSIAGLERLFPTAAEILRHVPSPVDGEPLDPDRPLRLPRRSVRTVVACSRAVARREIDLHVGADPQRLREQLLAQPGIGAWTAGYVAMRVLSDPDAWLPGDVALLSGARAAGVPLPEGSKAAAHRALAAHASAWAPWRSYAALHLWR